MREVNGPANIILGIDHIRTLLSEERYNEAFHILDLMEKDARTELVFLNLLFDEIEKKGIETEIGWLEAKKCST